LNLEEHEVEAFFASKAEAVAEIRTSEDVVVSRVGRELYEKFFRGYTRKQWGLDPSELDKSVTARAPRSQQPRRPLLRRHLPGDAVARLHPDV
jgi:UDP-galactopyranose mutase